MYMQKLEMSYLSFPLKTFFLCIAALVLICRGAPASQPRVLMAAPDRAARSSSASDLAEYMQLIRKVDRYAVISGNFWDWRDISMYRSIAGYHFGYDIAMPRGTPVPAGWEGRVIGICSWADGEWGISVLTRGGYTITYGHLVPRVASGKTVSAGEIVGTVAVNHVDVKVRDQNGNFVDFGKTCGLLPVSADAVIGDIHRYLALSSSSPGISRQAVLQEMKHLKGAISVLEEYLQIEQEAFREGESKVQSMEKLLEEELIARNSLEQEKEELRKKKNHVESLKVRLADQKTRLSLLRKQVHFPVDSKPPIAKKTLKKAAPSGFSELSASRVGEAKKKWDLFEKLFSEGAISRKELDDARKEYKKLQLEMMLERD